MSTIYAIQPLTCSIYKTNHTKLFPQSHPFELHFKKNAKLSHNLLHLRVTHNSKWSKLRSADENAEIPQADAPIVEQQEPSPEQTVAIPVSPSDKLIMFFQAEGTISESAIPNVTQALEETEGVSNLNVQISEGIASVELVKQTTIQATGVASSLVETIQGVGFKLQTLNLSFEDEESMVGAF